MDLQISIVQIFQTSIFTLLYYHKFSLLSIPFYIFFGDASHPRQSPCPKPFGFSSVVQLTPFGNFRGFLFERNQLQFWIKLHYIEQRIVFSLDNIYLKLLTGLFTACGKLMERNILIDQDSPKTQTKPNKKSKKTEY